MSTVQTIKIADLLQIRRAVTISENQQIMVRPLSLKEMMTLLMDQSENFLALYSQGLEGALEASQLAPFLVASPVLIAKIIAFASDDPDSAPIIETNMAATVQLIALAEIWKLSIPDQKKAQELLSGVMDLLRKLSEKGEEVKKNRQLKPSSPG